MVNHPNRSTAAKQPERLPTAREWLLENFGDSALEIEGIDGWGKTITISGASFVIDKGGFTFLSCSGTAIICLERKHTVDKHPMYVVHDDSAGGVWELRGAA